MDTMIALVEGQPFTELPDDLYIPPDALEVLLETFEGPLDLLLYLIKKQNLDILNIPIALITKQYMSYIDLMKELRLEIAAEYLLMAAMLAEIKSRMLLPRQQNDDEYNEEDPRNELIRRLQEYEQFKRAAIDIDELPRQNRDTFIALVEPPEFDKVKPHPEVSFDDLIAAFREVLLRLDNNAHHHIQREPLSIRERMSDILELLKNKSYCQFSQLFSFDEGRMGVVVAFIAVLELVKQSMIELVQTQPFSQIHVRAVSESE